LQESEAEPVGSELSAGTLTLAAACLAISSAVAPARQELLADGIRQRDPAKRAPISELLKSLAGEG
jgi:hypothetical protein